MTTILYCKQNEVGASVVKRILLYNDHVEKCIKQIVIRRYRVHLLHY